MEVAAEQLESARQRQHRYPFARFQHDEAPAEELRQHSAHDLAESLTRQLDLLDQLLLEIALWQELIILSFPAPDGVVRPADGLARLLGGEPAPVADSSVNFASNFVKHDRYYTHLAQVVHEIISHNIAYRVQNGMFVARYPSIM